jgi:uridine kinase
MKKPFMIAVTGGSGSGKSTVVDLVRASCPSIPILVLTLDHYYKDWSHLSPEQRAKVNFDHPDSLDSHTLCAHIQQVARGERFYRPSYDFTSHTRSEERVLIEPAPVVILDGIFSLYFEEIRSFFDLKIYLDVPSDVRFIRRLRRDMDTRGRTMESVVDQYLSTVRPMHTRFIEPCKSFADLLISWEHHNATTIEMLASIIQEKSKVA